MIQRVIIDVETRKTIRFDMKPDQHRSTLCDNLVCRGGEWADVQWSPDSKSVAFASTSRDHKAEQLRIADAATGKVREVREESVATFYESGNGRVNWRYLPESNELLWFSERDNWGTCFCATSRRDASRTRLLRASGTSRSCCAWMRRIVCCTSSAWIARRGAIPTLATSIASGSTARVCGCLRRRTPITTSPSGRYFVDSYSKPDAPPVTVLRDAEGKLMATLERADLSRLVAAGWKAPIPFTVKARDGVTDLYGLMFQPANLDPAKK